MLFRYVTRQAQVIRAYYSALGKAGVLLPLAFLVAAGQGMLALGMVFYLREVYGASGAQIGAFPTPISRARECL